jgi:hypothetical protein
LTNINHDVQMNNRSRGKPNYGDLVESTGNMSASVKVTDSDSEPLRSDRSFAVIASKLADDSNIFLNDKPKAASK